MAITGTALKTEIGNPVAAFTLNAGTGAGVADYYAGVTSYDAVNDAGADFNPELAPK